MYLTRINQSINMTISLHVTATSEARISLKVKRRNVFEVRTKTHPTALTNALIIHSMHTVEIGLNLRSVRRVSGSQLMQTGIKTLTELRVESSLCNAGSSIDA